MRTITTIATVAALAATVATRQADEACPPAGWTSARLEALRADQFAIDSPSARRTLAIALTACLGDPNPALRDRVAFEALSAWMRADRLDRPTLIELRDRLLLMLANARQPREGDASTRSDPQGFRGPFAALVLADVARTDRMKPWMAAANREALVQAAGSYLTGIEDYRAFSNTEGFRHGVAHGADFVLQLALNPAVTKPQLDRLLAAVATQVAPRQVVSYTAGEPDRLARPVLFIAQRGLHRDDEWKAWFAEVLSPKPLAAWDDAFLSEAGLAKRHNTRAFLLSLSASAGSSDNAGVRQLLPPIREGLKLLP